MSERIKLIGCVSGALAHHYWWLGLRLGLARRAHINGLVFYQGGFADLWWRLRRLTLCVSRRRSRASRRRWWGSLVIGLVAATAIFRFKGGVIPVIAGCAVLGLVWQLVIAWR